MRSDDIAYVRLNTFGDTADSELRAAIEELLAQNPKGLILDLRYNGGGYLDQGIAVTSEFLPGGQVVVYQKYGDGKLEEYTSAGSGVAVRGRAAESVGGIRPDTCRTRRQPRCWQLSPGV